MKLILALLLALIILPLLAQKPDVFEQHVGGVPAMDFSEIHLWWIINKRFAMNKGLKYDQANSPRLVKQNTVRFFRPLQPDSCTSSSNDQQKVEAIGDTLRALDVKIVDVKATSYEGFYDKLFGFEGILLK